MKTISHISALSAFALTICLAASCSDDKNEETVVKEQYPNVTITAGASQELTKGKDLKWKSDNELIASCFDGNVYGNRVGETRIACSNGAFTVKVTPQYTGFKEPCINFGYTKAMVKDAWNDNNNLISTVDTLVLYKGTDKAEYVAYIFKDEVLTSAHILTAQENSKELENWANERYIGIISLDNSVSFKSLDMKTDIVFSSIEKDGYKYTMASYTEVNKQ